MGSSCGGLHGVTGSVGSWILVLEFAVKHMWQLLVSESLPGSGLVI